MYKPNSYPTIALHFSAENKTKWQTNLFPLYFCSEICTAVRQAQTYLMIWLFW